MAVAVGGCDEEIYLTKEQLVCPNCKNPIDIILPLYAKIENVYPDYQDRDDPPVHITFPMDPLDHYEIGVKCSKCDKQIHVETAFKEIPCPYCKAKNSIPYYQADPEDEIRKIMKELKEKYRKNNKSADEIDIRREAEENYERMKDKRIEQISKEKQLEKKAAERYYNKEIGWKNRNKMPKFSQIFNVHALDSPKASPRRLGPDELELTCKKCKKPFHVRIREGKITSVFKHDLEKILEYPTKNAKTRKLFKLIGIPEYHSIMAFAIAMLIGFLISTIWPNVFLIMTGHQWMIPLDFNIFRGILSGFVLWYSYLIFKNIKTACGGLEKYIHDDPYYLQTFFPKIYSRKIFIIFLILSIALSPVFSVGGLRFNLYANIAYIAFPALNVFGFQIFGFFGILLFILGHPTLRFSGELFELNEKIEQISKVSMQIIILITIAITASRFYTMPFVWSSEIQSIEPWDFNIMIYSLLIYPVIIIIIPFVILIYFNHRIMVKIKREEIYKIRNEFIDTFEKSKLKYTLRSGKDYKEAEPLLSEINEAQQRSLQIQSSMALMSLEEKMSKIKEWPINMRTIGQFISALIIALVPLIISLFIDYI